jgi:CheY-like chemotaxis protein
MYLVAEKQESNMQRTFQDQDKPFIVYVDDDPDDLDLVGSTIGAINPLLVTQGYTNGREAFEFLESIPDGNRLPCLVILDLNMPDWNGFKTMEAIKRNSVYQHIPVFIFTNSDYPPHRELALAGGAADFITKPYNLNDLKEICVVFTNYCNGPARHK